MPQYTISFLPLYSEADRAACASAAKSGFLSAMQPETDSEKRTNKRDQYRPMATRTMTVPVAVIAKAVAMTKRLTFE